MSETVAVVGGGPSGLTLAHALAKQGRHQPVVLEALSAPGGAVRSLQRDGYLLECGPNSFIDRSPEFRSLIDALGLKEEVVYARPEAKARYLLCRGQLEPLPASPPALLKSKLLSVSGKLRLLAEPLLAKVGSGADESLEEFGLRHAGPEATHRLLDAMQVGIYAGKLEELSAESTFPQFVEMERRDRSLLLGAIRQRQRQRRGAAGAAGSAPVERPRTGSFRRGMGQFIEALSQQLGEVLRVRAPIESLQREGDQWKLSGPFGELSARHVVLATGSREASQLLRPLDATLSSSLEQIPSAPMAVVHLGVPKERVRHPLDGFGFLAPAQEGRATLGCIFSSTLFEGRAPEGKVLLTALLGGRRRPEVVNLEDRALIALARDELHQALGLDAEPELTQVIRHPDGIPQYVVGHRARLETIKQRLAQLPGLHLLGWAYQGVGVLDCVHSALKLASELSAP
jgi:oxygen-dependent protoporphyrinogen oxidase